MTTRVNTLKNAECSVTSTETTNDVDKPKYSLHLFAGGGGGILADIIHGIQPVAAVEIEEFQQRILALRFPQMPVWDDVTTFREDNPDTAEVIGQLKAHRDELVIAGGFPCQDISCAGRGAGLSGARSGLWFEYLRIIREIQPRWVFAENSPMLVVRGLDIVLGGLSSSGYDVAWQVLPASAVGCRHERKRIWITCRRRG